MKEMNIRGDNFVSNYISKKWEQRGNVGLEDTFRSTKLLFTPDDLSRTVQNTVDRRKELLKKEPYASRKVDPFAHKMEVIESAATQYKHQYQKRDCVPQKKFYNEQLEQTKKG